MHYRNRRGTALAVLLFATTISSSSRSLSQDSQAAGEIAITARKYSFTPDVIRVKKDEHVRLAITALDADHGFKLEAFQINQQLKKGQATSVEFIADRPGTFPFQCSHYCGFGHGKMKGQLIVE